MMPPPVFDAAFALDFPHMIGEIRTTAQQVNHSKGGAVWTLANSWS